MWLNTGSRFNMTVLKSCMGGIQGWGLPVADTSYSIINYLNLTIWCKIMPRFVKGTFVFEWISDCWGYCRDLSVCKHRIQR